MASTYTGNGGLELIGVGEQAGTWGTTTNNNFDIVDRAINGVGSIGLSGTTHTLTTTDGTLTDGGYKVLVFTGALGANNTVTISPNDQDKVYLVKNATTDSGSSGPYSVIITQGSGANATVTNGEIAWIFADGAGSGAVVTKQDISTTSGDFSVGDDLSLTSDAAVLKFGADSDVTLTHVADTGLLLNSTRQLQFNDASQNINAPSATVLDINATDEVEINATELEFNGTTADINANLDVSGTSTLTGNVTLGAQLIMPDVTSTKILVADGTSYQEVAVSGDVTIANTGAVTIANNAVETAMIADSQITTAKLAGSVAVIGMSIKLAGASFGNTASVNVSGVTDNGTGDYTIAVDTDFANANFSIQATTGDDDGTNRNLGELTVHAQAAGTVQIRSHRPSASENSARSAFDPDTVYVTCNAQ